MRPRTARGLVAVFFGLYLVALIWPGVLPFNRVRPLVLGLPFVFFWVALWVVAGGVALWLFDRHERAGARRPDAAPPPVDLPPRPREP